MTTTKKTIEVIFFPNGNTAVTENERQATKLQISWLILYAKFLESKGINPTEVSFLLPSGHTAEIFRIPNDYNWRIINDQEIPR